jgi:Polyketide cyclase / dehydrase and lipid transport
MGKRRRVQRVQRSGLCENRVVSTYRAQVHIDAPLNEVWALVGNPATYPEWWPPAVEIRGERFELGDPFMQVMEVAGRRLEYSRIIDRREELKELRWHCPTTGGFQHWLLTDAQGGTFVDMEMGMDPPALRYGLFDKTMGRWVIKRWSEQAVDGLRTTLA